MSRVECMILPEVVTVSKIPIFTSMRNWPSHEVAGRRLLVICPPSLNVSVLLTMVGYKQSLRTSC